MAGPTTPRHRATALLGCLVQAPPCSIDLDPSPSPSKPEGSRFPRPTLRPFQTNGMLLTLSVFSSCGQRNRMNTCEYFSHNHHHSVATACLFATKLINPTGSDRRILTIQAKIPFWRLLRTRFSISFFCLHRNMSINMVPNSGGRLVNIRPRQYAPLKATPQPATSFR